MGDRAVIDRRRTDESGLVCAAGVTTGTGELQSNVPIEWELGRDRAATQIRAWARPRRRLDRGSFSLVETAIDKGGGRQEPLLVREQWRFHRQVTLTLA